MVITQQVNDPLSLEKQREVRKVLRQTRRGQVMESRRRKCNPVDSAAPRLALGVMVPLRASGTGTDVAVLKRIGSRVDERAGVISIEASDPVPYVASQPDPNTFVVELRDVVAMSVSPTISRPIPRPGIRRPGRERARHRRRDRRARQPDARRSRCGRACAARAT